MMINLLWFIALTTGVTAVATTMSVTIQLLRPFDAPRRVPPPSAPTSEDVH